MATFLLIQESFETDCNCHECDIVVTPEENEMNVKGRSLTYLNCPQCGEFLGFKMSKEDLFRYVGHR